MSLSKTLYPQLSSGSIKKNRPDMTEILFDWDVKNQSKKSKQLWHFYIFQQDKYIREKF